MHTHAHAIDIVVFSLFRIPVQTPQNAYSKTTIYLSSNAGFVSSCVCNFRYSVIRWFSIYAENQSPEITEKRFTYPEGEQGEQGERGGDEWVREWLSRRAQSSAIISCMYLYPCYRFNNRDFRRKREKAELDVPCISFGAFLCACVRVCVYAATHFFFTLTLTLSMLLVNIRRNWHRNAKWIV